MWNSFAVNEYTELMEIYVFKPNYGFLTLLIRAFWSFTDGMKCGWEERQAFPSSQLLCRRVEFTFGFFYWPLVKGIPEQSSGVRLACPLLIDLRTYWWAMVWLQDLKKPEICNLSAGQTLDVDWSSTSALLQHFILVAQMRFHKYDISTWNFY